MKVLVTGHLGYIGAVLTPMVLQAGHDVLGMDIDYYGGCDFVGKLADVPTLRKDIRDVTASDLKGVDAVFHLAALSNDPLGNLNPELTFDINHRASVKLAQAAKKAGAGLFVFSSSCSNYGAGGDGLLDESAAFNPVTPYGVSKTYTERDVAPLADGSFSPVFLRNATAYGISPRIRFDLVLNNLVAWAMAAGKVLIKSDGTPWRPLVHIEDISRAFLACLDAPRAAIHNQAFNIGQSSENHRVRDLANLVAEMVPGCEVEFAKDASPDLRNYRVNCDKAAKILNFNPQWTARRGVQELYDVYKQVGVSVDDFEGPRFKRISRIQRLMSEGALDTNLRRVA